MSKKFDKDALREKFERFKNSGGRTTKESKKKDSDVFKALVGEKQAFRLLTFPDGEIFKEYSVVFGVDLEEVEGQTWLKDNRFLCPWKQFGKKSAVQDWSQVLWNESGKTTDHPKGAEARNMWATPMYVFVGLIRGREDEGPKLYPATNKVYNQIMEEIFDEDNDELGGLIADGNEKALDLIVSAVKAASGFNEITAKSAKKATKTLPAKCKLTLEQVEEMMPDPDSYYRTVTYEETKEILDRYNQRVHGFSEGDETERGGSSDEEQTDDLDEKFSQMTGD